MAQLPYDSKFPDAHGIYSYTATEDDTWQRLVTRQLTALQGLAVDDYFIGVETLRLARPAVPQLADISKRLAKASGFGVEGVPALISPRRFYDLLSKRKFPVATFLRRPEDMDYLQEPDIFHEVFGHCPLLTNRAYTDFLVRTAADGDMADLVAALLPCAWGYVYIAEQLANNNPPSDQRYADWITQYASPEFADAANWLKREMNRLSEFISEKKKQQLIGLFVLSSRYELKFWDMCWEGEEW